jgi:hypothetical protein
MYLNANCIMPDNIKEKYRGMRWQVAWGKHTPANRKWNNTAAHDEKVNKTNILPVVLIRDAYSWMQSTCKHPYGAQWPHRERCPNLVPSQADREALHELRHSDTVEVTINYKPPAKWDSLVDAWSDWYNQYLQADYPRLIVRFEDLIFHPKELINTICECAGAKPKQDTFSYVVDAGKWGPSHKSSNMISAMAKYGSDLHRLDGLNQEDLAYAADHVDANLMRLFHYKVPSIA